MEYSFKIHSGGQHWTAPKPIICAIALFASMDWFFKMKGLLHIICCCQADMQQVQQHKECDYSEWMCAQEINLKKLMTIALCSLESI